MNSGYPFFSCYGIMLISLNRHNRDFTLQLSFGVLDLFIIYYYLIDADYIFSSIKQGISSL